MLIFQKIIQDKREYAGNRFALLVQFTLRDLFMDSVWSRHREESKEAMNQIKNLPARVLTQVFYEWYDKAIKIWDKIKDDKEYWTKPAREPRSDRSCKEYQEWRMAVLTRDKFKCRRCNSTKELCTHHIKPYKKYISLRIEEDNGITLCHECHKKEHRKNNG